MFNIIKSDLHKKNINIYDMCVGHFAVGDGGLVFDEYNKIYAELKKETFLLVKIRRDGVYGKIPWDTSQTVYRVTEAKPVDLPKAKIPVRLSY